MNSVDEALNTPASELIRAASSPATTRPRTPAGAGAGGEVVEHVDCFREIFDMLRPGGLLMLTSPVPHLDWACRILERLGLNQRRTSPHDHLLYFRDVPLFEPLEIRTIGFMMQWERFRKPV